MTLVAVLPLVFLILCEPITSAGGTYDEIQRKGAPTQIDSHEYGPPEKAIDGIYDTIWDEWAMNVASRTQAKGATAWWRLTFPDFYWVQQIEIQNSVDECCEDWIQGMNVTVYYKIGDSETGTSSTVLEVVEGQKYYQIEVEKRVEVVEIKGGDGDNPLQIIEMKVYGVACSYDEGKVWNESECIECDPGLAPNEQTTLCVPCKAGHYKDTTMTKCTMCTDNAYSKTIGSVSCADCVPGAVSHDHTQCSSGELQSWFCWGGVVDLCVLQGTVALD
ncbi:hypothetical protein ACHWQZ_G013848 [Mnemiopsis leidyi]